MVTDTDALAQIETLIQTQRPAAQPWQPVTDYSFITRSVLEEPHVDRILRAFAPSLVYDIGCGPGHLVRLLEPHVPAAVGFDKHPSGDACELDIAEAGPFHADRADLVICREVLEHLTLREIRRAVTNLCALSSRFVYVTTRFAKDPAHLLSVDTADDLDPTHITMLNQDFLRLLFVMEGFRRRADMETILDWQQKGRVLVYERG